MDNNNDDDVVLPTNTINSFVEANEHYDVTLEIGNKYRGLTLDMWDEEFNLYEYKHYINRVKITKRVPIQVHGMCVATMPIQEVMLLLELYK